MLLTIAQLIENGRIWFPTDSGRLRLVQAMEHAGACGRIPHLCERFNYLAPREDETIVIEQDIAPLSFFWRQITKKDHVARLRAHQVYGEDYYANFPQRTYHGALIYRDGDPITWSVHT